MQSDSPKSLFPYCTVKITHTEEPTQMKTGRTYGIKAMGKRTDIFKVIGLFAQHKGHKVIYMAVQVQYTQNGPAFT